MAVSALQSIIDDTAALIEGITPTARPGSRWRFEREGRPQEGGRTRSYSVTPIEPQQEPFSGAGLERLSCVLELETMYEGHDWIDLYAADRLDLAAALNKTSSYPSGSSWALERRDVLEPGRTEREEGARVTCYHRIAIVYQQAKTSTG